MKKILILLSSCLFILTACQQPNTTDTAFNELLQAYSNGKLALNPINATFAGDASYNAQFPNTLSEAYGKKTVAFYSKYQEEVAKFEDSQLSSNQQLSKKVLLWDCQMALAQGSFKNDLLMPLNQMWTVHLIMGQFASASSAQPFNTVDDYLFWLNRLNQYNTWLHSAKARMQEGIQEGYVLPKSLIVKVIPQFEELTNTDIEKHLYFSPVHKFPNSFTEEDRANLTAAYTAMLSEKLIPTFTTMATFLSTDYLAAGRTSSGISALPNGTEYYNHAIKKFTTTNMTSDEIHHLGLQEVARILAEMETVKTAVGFTGSIQEFFDFVRTNKNLMPYKTPEEIIANFNAIHETMKPQLAQLFGNTPKTAFVVKQTESFREASASAEYNPGSLDGTRPGVFYTPIPDATKYNVFTDEALFLHEAIPGHHYQISLTQENQDLPDFRKTLWYSAYGEGWALYTENLGKELGLYTDPYQYFGMLGMEMHRAIRLVVDTGMHAKGWSREKAIAYSLANEAEPEASIVSEIERYMANPGQALSYKIGQLKISALRKKATDALGDQFDIRAFHNQVLETGCIPLALLEAKIDKWIAAQK